MSKDIRRHHRVTYRGPVRISWETHGQMKYAQGKCVDASEGGLRIEAPEMIPVRASVWLRAERIGFSGSATVKHVTRVGAKYVLGLELSQPIAEKVLAGQSTPDPAVAP